MKLVSKATDPVASSVSSHGIVSSACCSRRTGADAGRDHIESKMYICRVGPHPQ